MVLNTSTPKVSLIISSLSLLNSGCMRATESLLDIQLPNADILSSIIPILTFSGRDFYKVFISAYVIIDGTNNPF